MFSPLRLFLSTGGARVNTLKLNIAVKSGSSGIIPCVYDKQHQENRKYLCQGTYWSSCYILAYAGETGNFSITDYPDQSIFTVRWDKLEISDSGYYWCAVEIDGTPDAGYYLYLTVQSAPDVSVKSSSVSGHEGDNVSVQCFYTSGYKDKPKQWCRYKDKGCYTEKRTDTSHNSSVQIRDDGRSSFTVLMTGLRLSDSGWYLCSVGDLQVPVQLTVNEPKPGGARVNTLKLNIAVKSGSSGIIPCVYDKQHKENLKYLCWGTYWSSCRILAYAGETGKFSITDYPDQSIFTVRWDKLEISDSGYYWCAVEIGGYGTVDAGYYLYLTVQSAPGVSVKNSSVSGHEEKRTDTSQNPSVQISDDGRRSFTVLMTGLRLNDSGWYFCSVGDLQAPVQLTVNEPKPGKITNQFSYKNGDTLNGLKISSCFSPFSDTYSNNYTI
ncbi:hypothetical protein PO909_031542 [Leuciscus waleckii]